MNFRFDGFDSQLIASIAARASLDDETIVGAILAPIAEHTNALVSAGKSGYAPVDQIKGLVCELLNQATQANIPAKSGLEVIGLGIDEILAAHGFVPVRTERLELEDGRYTSHKFYYFRPTEHRLFEEIDDGVPVILATSADFQRLGRAVISRYLSDGTGRSRRVLAWTIASGLVEIFERDGQLDFREAGHSELYEASTAIKRLSEICRAEGIERAEALRDVIDKAGTLHGVAQFEHEGHTLRLFQTVGAGSGRTLKQEFVIDDFDENGDELELPLELLMVMQLRLDQNAVEEASERDRWPRKGPDGKTEDRMSLLGLIDFIMDRQNEGALYVVYDGDVFLSPEGGGEKGANITAAFLRDASVRLKRAGKGAQMLILSPPLTPPASLTSDVSHLDLPLPSRRELLAEIRPLTRIVEEFQPGLNDHPLQVTDSLLNLIDAAAGMTLSDATNTILTALRRGAHRGMELVLAINEAKRAAIRRSAALELIDREPPRDLVLGGMERFWRWLEVRHRIFRHPELASQFGIDKRPKGVLILGIPGTGKSLAAKLIAREWQLPLIRLDMGAVHDKWVGSSEQRIRDALKIAQAMSPCVLWIDEIDKGIAQGEGTYSNSSDMNIRATLLTWLQENDSAVFVVATANRFANLPPELTRAGRFDARFFFGCPNREGCEDILRIHLELRRVPGISASDRLAVAASMHGFTGAEIEQVVLDGLCEAFAADRAVTGADLLAAACRMKPLIRAVGHGLDEVWDLIEQGRVEVASDHFLSRADVARLIDPESFSPMYCRLDRIEGWERHHARATRLLMRDQLGLPAAVILDTGDPEWVYLQTNMKLDPEDDANFKFLDQLSEIEGNGVIDTLIVQCGLETIWFENQTTLEIFNKRQGLAAYSELFRLVSDRSQLEEN